MALLTVRDLRRQFDTDPVFAHVTFDVQPGDRIGLVGPNGTGKTTLMKILAGLDHEDFGELERPGNVKVAMLEQHVDLTRDRTLFEEAKSGLEPLYALQRESLELADQFGRVAESEAAKLHARYDAVIAELDRLNAHQLDHRVKAVLDGLGFTADQFDRPIQQFSGGQQNRMLLARILLTAPDVMLLDEPTNHLDIAATEWLEDYLARGNQTLIVISHDRYFLDRVTNRTIELFDRKASYYKGNFSAYWKQREDRQEFQRKAFEKQQEFVSKTEDFIKRNSYGLKSTQAQDRVKKLERVEKIELIRDVKEVPMGFGEPTRTGDWVFDATNLSKGFGTPLFRDFTMRIERGDRIAILGPNGAGKTTLLRTLIGELPPDSGKLRFGTGVKLAYYDQQLASVDPELNAVEAVVPPNRPDFIAPVARSLLARFGMTGDIVFQKVSTMSGGERSRVALARLSAQNANVLTLDEPTNHLDLWARQSLENALRAFDGTMLFVSHDRYFVNQLATSVIVFEPDGWHHYPGNYSAYIDFIKRRDEELKAVRQAQETAATRKSEANGTPETKSSTDKPRRKRKFPFRKTPEIEREIAQKEEQLAQYQDDMVSPAVLRDGQRMKQIATDFEALQQQLAVLYEHWEEALELN